MRGGTKGAPSKQRYGFVVWTGSRALKNPGVQSPDQSDLSVLCFVNVTFRRSVEEFLR